MPDQKHNNKWIVHDSLEVDDDGYVIGSCYSGTDDDGWDVIGGVTSYELDRRYDADMNHVPHIVITDSNGVIHKEPHTVDTTSAQTAIDRTRKEVKYYFKVTDQFK